MTDEELKSVEFLTEAARYFRKRPTKGEDRAHWANVFNADNCEKAAKLIREQAAKIERLQMKLDDYFCSVCQKPKRECPGWHMDGATKVYHSYGDYCD